MLKVVKKGWWPLKPFLGVKRGLDWGTGLLTFAALFGTARVAAGCGGAWPCTYYGARFLSKKTLISAQNLENKGSKIFLPPRSMVLKVVTGKI
jgi:hypothetical protein